MKFEIEWAGDFRKDGTKRPPRPSTMHGWLAKMRGTLLGNEKLRSRGMFEMKQARAVKKWQRDQKKKDKSRPKSSRSKSSGNNTSPKPRPKPSLQTSGFGTVSRGTSYQSQRSGQRQNSQRIVGHKPVRRNTQDGIPSRSNPRPQRSTPKRRNTTAR